MNIFSRHTKNINDNTVSVLSLDLKALMQLPSCTRLCWKQKFFIAASTSLKILWKQQCWCFVLHHLLFTEFFATRNLHRCFLLQELAKDVEGMEAPFQERWTCRLASLCPKGPPTSGSHCNDRWDIIRNEKWWCWRGQVYLQTTPFCICL